jgi:hypothetical protein
MPAIVRFILGSFLVLLAGSAPPVTAQAVRGDLRDVDQNRPLPGARLYLLNEDAVAVDSTLTDRTGRFRLAAPDDGEYTVYFRIDGWASFGSKTLRLESDTIVDLEFRVPLVHNSALSQMRDIIDMDERLQSSLPELCGEPLRPWEAGLLVGVIRVRATGEPIAGARVAVAAPGPASPARRCRARTASTSSATCRWALQSRSSPRHRTERPRERMSRSAPVP